MNLKAKIANDRSWGISYKLSSGENPFSELYWHASIIQSQESHIWPHTKIHSHVLSQLGGVMRTDTWKNVGGLNKGGTGEGTHHCDHTLSLASAASASEHILIDRIRGCQERERKPQWQHILLLKESLCLQPGFNKPAGTAVYLLLFNVNHLLTTVKHDYTSDHINAKLSCSL